MNSENFYFNQLLSSSYTEILNLETESIGVFLHYLSCENLSHTMCQILQSIDSVFKYTD